MDLKWRAAGIENYTTAEDMALLLEKIYHGELVSPEASAQMLEILKRQKVNDRLPKGLPGYLVIAHKTGPVERHGKRLRNCIYRRRRFYNLRFNSRYKRV